jgi:subtilisin family serine protease
MIVDPFQRLGQVSIHDHGIRGQSSPIAETIHAKVCDTGHDRRGMKDDRRGMKVRDMRWRRLGAVVLAASMLALALPPAATAQAAQPPWGEWWLDTWNMNAVWQVSQGAGVTVAVIDSGVDGQESDLRGRVLTGTGFTMSTACPPECWIAFRGVGDTDSGTGGSIAGPGYHGTGMAELIAGQGEISSLSDNNYYPVGVGLAGQGIAPQAKILPVNINFDGIITNGSFQYGVPGGIRWAVQHGAKVISISLGQALEDSSGNDICPAPTEDAIAYAWRHNVVVVVAAGNYNAQGDPAVYPAQCPGVLTVGAVDQHGSVPSWSERQPYVAVAAPGVNIPVLQPDAVFFNGRPATLEEEAGGTSSSAALVAGAVALVRSRYPAMPAREVVQRIIDTAVSPPGQPVPSKATGYGVVNIQHALDVTGYPVPASAPNPVNAAFNKWLASSQGKQYLAAYVPPPGVQISPWVVGFLILIVLAVLAAVVTVIVIAVSRARRRRPPQQPPAPGPPPPPAAPWQQPGAH